MGQIGFRLCAVLGARGGSAHPGSVHIPASLSFPILHIGVSENEGYLTLGSL